MPRLTGLVALLPSLGGVHSVLVTDVLPTSPDFAVVVQEFRFDRAGLLGMHHVGFVAMETAHQPKPEQGKLYFMAFDNAGPHWPAVQQRWESSSCEEKMAHAVQVQEMPLDFKLRVDQSNKGISWHLAFVACGLKVKTPLRYTMHVWSNHGSSPEESSESCAQAEMLDTISAAVLKANENFPVLPSFLLQMDANGSRARRAVGTAMGVAFLVVLVAAVLRCRACFQTSSPPRKPSSELTSSPDLVFAKAELLEGGPALYIEPDHPLPMPGEDLLTRPTVCSV